MWSSVELRELRVFLVLADEQHFGRTAERLGLTTSRVSQLLAQLERRVGGRLVERTSRRVALTPLGTRLGASLGPAVAALDRALTEARDAAAGVVGVVRLGMYSVVSGGPRLAEVLDAFRARHPGAAVEIVDTAGADPVERMRRGEVDVVATRLPVGGDDVAVGPELSAEDRIAVVGRGHRLADRTSIGHEELAGETLARPPGLDPVMLDAFLPPATPSGREVRRDVVRTPLGVLSRVARGEVVHLSVPSFLEHYRHPDVVAVAVTDLPASRTALVHLRARPTALVQALIATATEVLAP